MELLVASGLGAAGYYLNKNKESFASTGCTDSSANNYDETATEDDGTCE